MRKDNISNKLESYLGFLFYKAELGDYTKYKKFL